MRARVRYKIIIILICVVVPFTTEAANVGAYEMADADGDNLPDGWEQQIVDANPSDEIADVADVRAEDDFDGDGLTNGEESAVGTDPTNPDSDGNGTPDGQEFGSLTNGLEFLRLFIESDPLNRSYLALADNSFQLVIDAEPNNYTAKVYGAFAKLANLINDPELVAVPELFGYTIPVLLQNPEGQLELTNAPLSDEVVHTLYANALPVIDAALADLGALPTNWTGSAEVSTNYFPLDETVYVDIGDVVAGKAVLKIMRSLLLTAKANQLDVNYDRLIHPVNGPIATIIVDGLTNDWSGVPIHLKGTRQDVIRYAKAARGSTSLYVMVSYDEDDIEEYGSLDGGLTLELQSEVMWYYSPWGYSNVTWSDTGIETNITDMILTNGILEAEFQIPDGISVSNVSVDYAYAGYERSDIGWWDWCELSSFDHVPVNDLLEGHPRLFHSVKAPELFLEASNDLKAAIGYIQQADSLITNRTDGLLHFIEYDVAYTNDRDEFFANLDVCETSLGESVALNPSDYDASLSDIGDVDVFLGAFYASPYVLRNLMPETRGCPATLISGPLPDPTFAGILPGMTQTRINELLFDYAGTDLDHDNIPDDWENEHFGHSFNCIPGADSDGDVYSNWHEYIAGTDPADSASVFLTSIQPRQIIQWSCISGRVYSVWWTTNLMESFQPLETNLPWTQGSYTNPDAPPCSYYKIKVELEE